MTQDPEGRSTRPETEKRRCIARFAFEATDDDDGFSDAFGDSCLRTYSSPKGNLFKFETGARPGRDLHNRAASAQSNLMLPKSMVAKPKRHNTEPIPVSPLHKQLKAQLHVEKVHFGLWSAWKSRYVEFQPITKCLFYWRKESTKLRGRAKCFDNVVGCQLRFPKASSHAIMRISYGGGHAQAKLKFADREVAKEWANAVAASQVPEPSTQLQNQSSSYPATPTGGARMDTPSGTPNKATPSSSIRSEDSDSRKSKSNEVTAKTQQIQSLFRSEFQRQTSKRHVKNMESRRLRQSGVDLSACYSANSEYSLFSRASYSTRDQIPSLSLAL